MSLVMEATILGAVVGGALRPLADKLMDLANEEAALLACGLQDRIRNLSYTLEQIHSVLKDAERLKTPAVRVSLERLKDAAYDAEDVLDEYLAESASRSRGSVSCPIPSLNLWNCARALCFRDRVVREIERIRDTLSEISKDQKDLELKVSGQAAEVDESPWKERETGSLPDKHMEVLGRDTEKERIIEELRSGDGSAAPSTSISGGGGKMVSLILIAGMGGIGKTTLAQAVFNDYSIQTAKFGVRKWLFVGKKFDPCELILLILKGSSVDPQEKHYPLSDPNPRLEDLQLALKEKLKYQRFLIVLDDVWSVSREEWEMLWNPLTHGGRGGKIIVTSRNQGVTKAAIAPDAVHNLGCLSDEDCWSIFQKHAFAGGNAADQPELEEIGRELVAKLKGVPIAARIAGGFLRGAPRETWMNTLKRSEMWPLTSDEDDILPVLRLSYQYLAPHLKRCFVFCSIFPKNHQFEKTRLVRIWMAHGLIQPEKGQRMEDAGSIYLEDLISWYFFQYVNGSYVMHDFLHDLAQSISKDECVIVAKKADIKANGAKVRHISFYGDVSEAIDLDKDFCNFKKLRTLLYLHKENVYPDFVLSDKLFNHARRLRVLDLAMSNITKLPSSVGALKHLRYLDVTCSGVRKLPESFCKLRNLQTLRLPEECQLPKLMSQLINLRHLEVEGSHENISSLRWIGKLTSLQELNAFRVGKKEGHKIGELKNMTQLRQLCIWNLENVEDEEEAKQIKMKDRSCLERLEMVWSQHPNILMNGRIVEKVLEYLQPHPNLRMLKISGYCGSRKPAWMTEQLPSLLVSICLCNCQKIETLPPFGILRYLKSLEIASIDSVKEVGSEFYGEQTDNAFPMLEKLVFEDMGQWEQWSGTDGHPFLPSINALRITRCPKLMNIPPLPFTMSELKMHMVGLHDPPRILNDTGMPNSSLSCFEVNSCEALTTFSSLLPYDLQKLEILTVANCKELKSLFEEERYNSLTSLRDLKIENCPKLITLAAKCFQNLSSLSFLHISECPQMDSLPEMGHLGKLEKLYVRNCEMLKSLGLKGEASRNSSATSSMEPSTTSDGSTTINSITSSKECASSSISSLPGTSLLQWRSLERLEIEQCRELELSDLQVLVSVSWLRVIDCPKLITDTSSSSQEENCLKVLYTDNRQLIGRLLPKKLKCLEQLIIYPCPQLTSFTDYEKEGWRSLTSLEILGIHACGIQSLPELQCLSSLRDLYIYGCRDIQKLPDDGLPLSLKSICISGCPSLVEACQRKGSAEWNAIANVPEKYIK